MKLKVIVTGATGMVGEGVLIECLANPAVEEVLMVNRKHLNMQHPKLQELIVPDFIHLGNVTNDLSGYNACFFCAGISSLGMSEEKYRHITYDVTMNFAKTLVELNPDMTFIYVSGAQTDSSEQGRLMWARVKGKTENDLLMLHFKNVYNFRPGFMKATTGQKNIKSYYKFFSWLYPVLRLAFPNGVSTLTDVARAMILSITKGYPKHILEVKDINGLAKI
ncbi:MAG: epimerase [Sphingobacteriaceae bacterium]|nr:MAG: epimerase [Sphingobacteriaceae bacterium]